MQAEKEDSTGFVKNIKKKVQDWGSRHLWTARLIVYGFLLLLVILVGTILFTHFNLFHTDVTSARYMLSALVQSQAAIVAIVITLTLIAVQLTASAYSPRVIDIFKKNPDMWILLSVYGLSIFYGFIILKLVVGAEGEFVSQSVIWSLGCVSISFESYVSLAYWLGAFTFVALFPYMLNIISLLKSENIIKRLAIEITKAKIINSEEDPIQPIMDIIHGSIMIYDLETTRVGLKKVTKQVIEIIDLNDEEKISNSFCAHLERVGGLAISREDAESTIEVSKNLENFGTSTAEKGLKDATVYAVWPLGKVGKAAAGKELEDATKQVAMSLGEVGTAAAGKELGGATQQVARSLGKVGKAAAEKGLENATVYAVWSLENVGKAAVGIEPENATVLAARSLGEVGKAAAEKGLEYATVSAARSLGEVGKAAAGKGLENATQQAAGSLAELTILSEEIVKTAIHDYESKLEEKDPESFQKFIKIYEQELEKLQAEK
ncbi:MAG: DUF2254 family protein [Halobacteriota archaeon]